MREMIVATKFLRDEEQIKQDWLCLLVNNETVPLDIAYKAHVIKVQKEYYPYAIFSMTCEGSWSATSYWEHQEEYQEPFDTTVYVDYRGGEHEQGGHDFKTVNGKVEMIERRAKTVTRYRTKKKTVTDNVEQTSGNVGPLGYTHKIWIGPEDGKNALMSWIDRFNDAQMEHLTAEQLENALIIPDSVSQDEAYTKAENRGHDHINSCARGDVPGTRYTDFNSDTTVYDIQRENRYIGVYHIFYEYEGKQYDSLLSGGDCTADAILGDCPVDTVITTRFEKIQTEIDKNGFFSKRTLFLWGGILCVFLAIGGISMLSTAGMYSSYGMNTDSGLMAGGVILLLLSLAGGAFCFMVYAAMKKRQKKAKTELAGFKENNATFKRQVCELIQNDSVPEETKGTTIEGWLRNNSDYYAMFDSQQKTYGFGILDSLKSLFGK